MASPPEPPRIDVIAGVNGAGKSSVGGASYRQQGTEYFNPDEATNRIRAKYPLIPLALANSKAWHEGKRMLERAIAERLNFAFETTLGGNTIPQLLERAIANGIEVRIWFVGLTSPELHIERVRARVARGGHDIPASKIRSRYDSSRLNLVRLLPGLTELRLYDNSTPADPASGQAPKPRLILHVEQGVVLHVCPMDEVPDWAKPIVMAALRG